eukprot:g47195.t1
MIAMEQQKAQFQLKVHNFTDVCWEKCVEKLSSRLDSRTEACLVNCVDRFVDTTLAITNRFAQMVQKGEMMDYWDWIHLLEVYNSSLLSGSMRESMRKGISTLIYKWKWKEEEIRNCAQTHERLQWFELASGANVNRGEGKAMFFGNWADQYFIPFTTRTDYLKVLGIWFGGAEAKSWEENTSKMRQKLVFWEHRSLSIITIFTVHSSTNFGIICKRINHASCVHPNLRTMCPLFRDTRAWIQPRKRGRQSGRTSASLARCLDLLMTILARPRNKAMRRFVDLSTSAHIGSPARMLPLVPEKLNKLFFCMVVTKPEGRVQSDQPVPQRGSHQLVYDQHSRPVGQHLEQSCPSCQVNGHLDLQLVPIRWPGFLVRAKMDTQVKE